MLKHLALAALGTGLIACGDTESVEGAGQYDGAVSQVHNVSEMLSRSESGRVTLDLRNTAVGFQIDRNVDYSAVDVICPGGRQMPLSRWVPELAADFEVAPSELNDGLFLYQPRGDVTAFGPPYYNCAPDCYVHIEDNGWTTCTCEPIP
jgi:hypothetical protein